MTPIEIVIMLAAIGIVVGVIGSYIYKKIKKKPTGECSHCHIDMRRAIKKAAKELKKDKENN